MLVKKNELNGSINLAVEQNAMPSLSGCLSNEGGSDRFLSR